jgi:hypothetical protein
LLFSPYYSLLFPRQAGCILRIFFSRAARRRYRATNTGREIPASRASVLSEGLLAAGRNFHWPYFNLAPAARSSRLDSTGTNHPAQAIEDLTQLRSRVAALLSKVKQGAQPGLCLKMSNRDKERESSKNE